jgi:acyl-CoA thioester hydrolase
VRTALVPTPTPDAEPTEVFRHPVRVYWEDTDAGAVVFYANYLKFFERARTEWLRSLGFSQEAMRLGQGSSEGVMFVVAETRLRYLRPARLDDALDITVAVLARRAASLDVAQRCLRAGELLCEGTIRIGCVDAGTFRPQRIPLPLLQTLP